MLRQKFNGCVPYLPPFPTPAPLRALAPVRRYFGSGTIAVGPEAMTKRSLAQRQHMLQMLPCSRRACHSKSSSLFPYLCSSPLFYSSNTPLSLFVLGILDINGSAGFPQAAYR